MVAGVDAPAATLVVCVREPVHPAPVTGPVDHRQQLPVGGAHRHGELHQHRPGERHTVAHHGHRRSVGDPHRRQHVRDAAMPVQRPGAHVGDLLVVGEHRRPLQRTPAESDQEGVVVACPPLPQRLTARDGNLDEPIDGGDRGPVVLDELGSLDRQRSVELLQGDAVCAAVPAPAPAAQRPPDAGHHRRAGGAEGAEQQEQRRPHHQRDDDSAGEGEERRDPTEVGVAGRMRRQRLARGRRRRHRRAVQHPRPPVQHPAPRRIHRR